jgi:hypothetical protein
MLPKNNLAAISCGLAGCMFIVAAGELAHGTPVSEIHLIPPGSLATGTAGSTVTMGAAGLGYHPNAITEAEYGAPADSSPLPHDGLMVPALRWTPSG